MLLLEDVAVPVEHDLPPVSGTEQGEAGHRIRMMDMDNVIVPAPPPQFPDKGRGYHCCGHFHKIVAADQLRMRIQADYPLFPLGADAHHVTVHSSGRQA